MANLRTLVLPCLHSSMHFKITNGNSPWLKVLGWHIGVKIVSATSGLQMGNHYGEHRLYAGNSLEPRIPSVTQGDNS